MAMVVSSSFMVDSHTQSDGSHYCRERHVLDDGRVLKSIYRLSHKVDPNDMLARHAAAIDHDLVVHEQQRVEADAVRAKFATVLDAAVDAGTLTTDDVRKLGYSAEEVKVSRG